MCIRDRISIVPRGMSALGYTLQLPTEERFLNSREDLQGQIATLLGGRSAEEIVFGKITTGASNDLQRATDIAEQMVGTYGMSDTLGPLAYDKQGGGRFLGGGNNPRRSVSDATAQAIDKEVRGLVDKAHDDALAILRQNMALLETIAQTRARLERWRARRRLAPGDHSAPRKTWPDAPPPPADSARRPRRACLI